MVFVMGIRFVDSNKVYYFKPEGRDIPVGSFVIVETEKGSEYGEVVTKGFSVDSSKLSIPLLTFFKVADEKDAKQYEKNSKDEKKALLDAQAFVKELDLDMRILDAHFTFDRKQLLFHFLSDDRVDFRILAKKLAGIYKTRIELRQIGVRDKARSVGGCGQCGKPLCCSTFLRDLNSVSINMAKHQNLALNPQKINGACGRLMCCLAYENDLYYEYKKDLPKVGETVSLADGKGKVLAVDLFDRSYTVEMENGSIVEVK